jgi:hypothetical protein
MGVKSSGLVMLVAALGVACGSGKSTPATGSAGGGGTDGGAVVALELTVSPDEARHAVSPLIYGVNGTSSASSMKATLIRFGGHGSPAYNWEINATNLGRLGGYENRPASGSSAPGGAAKAVLDEAAKNQATGVLTVPIGDYVAADKKAGDVRASGTSYLKQRFDANKATKGTELSGTPDLADGAVYQDEFASWAKAAAGSTPVLFALDNEPALWFEDHPEIHPQPTGYDELVQRDTSMAKAIKAAWPGVPILGYVGYGWQSFMDLQQSPDAKSKGEFLSYYLDKMKAAEAANGERLLDYLDVHWWPEAEAAGVRVIETGAVPEVAAARLQAPRDLWDPDYQENSWIQNELGQESIHMIPRLKSEIATHYPGTKLSISAWYYGGGDEISGAIATADVLGIFGREGVDAAAIELSGGDDSFTLAAFSAYLDYDGHGARFGDTSVSATTNDRVGSSIYASTQSSDNARLVIIALNKLAQPRPATLTIDSTTTYKSCLVYTLTQAKANMAPHTRLLSKSGNSFGYELPALSVSVLVPRP